MSASVTSPVVTRLKAEDLSVADMEGFLGDYVDAKPHRDLLKHFLSAKEIQWSHAPKAALLLEYSDIFFLAIDICPCLKICHKTLTKAIMCLHNNPESGAILFGAAQIGADLLAVKASFRIRCILSKYRDLASDEKAYTRMLREVAVLLLYTHTINIEYIILFLSMHCCIVAHRSFCRLVATTLLCFARSGRSCMARLLLAVALL